MEIVILIGLINTKLKIVYIISTYRSSAEKLSNPNMFAEQTGGSRCGFFVTVYDLIWPEGGLCELEEERSLWRTQSVGGEKGLGSPGSIN